MAHRLDRYRDHGSFNGVQLYVKYIPVDFDEECLFEIFSEYGDVFSVHIPEKAFLLGRDFLYGYVTYRNKSEANAAMEAFDGTPPYYLSVCLSKLAGAELLREIPPLLSTPVFAGDVPPTTRRHSSMGYSYKLTTTPDGKRTVQGVQSGVPRRSVPFHDKSNAVVKNLFEEEDIPAPGQKQKFPCYKCGNLTFRKCVCGGAYYCKEACRMSDWPEHKHDCLKKLESQPNFQAGVATGGFHRDTGMENSHLKTESSRSRISQVENGMQLEQKTNHSRSLGHRQPRFPAMNDDDLQTEVFGIEDDGKRHPKFAVRSDRDMQNEKFANTNDSPNKALFTDCGMQNAQRKGHQKDGGERWKESDEKHNQHDGESRRTFNQGDCNNRRDFNQRDGENRSNFNQHDGENKRNFNQGDGDNRRNFNRGDGDNRRNFNRGDGDNRRNFNRGDGDNRRNFNHQGDGDNHRNFNQGDGDNRKNFNKGDGDSRRNFKQGNGDNQKNFNQRDGDNRRNFNQRDGDNRRDSNRDGDNRRNFNQRDGENRRNFNQRDGENRRNFNRDGENRRNFNQRDGDNRRNFSRGEKFSSGGMNENESKDWMVKQSDGSVLNRKESEESWDQPDVEKIETVKDVPQKVVEDTLPEKIPQIPDSVLGAEDNMQQLAVPTDPHSTVVAEVVVVMMNGPKTFFVQRVANNETLKIICSEIIKSPSLPLVKPEVGLLCAATFEGEWYRARVLMLEPQLAVQFIDYGNVDICDPAMLHQLPESIVSFPPMVEEIELVDETQVEKYSQLSEGAIISIKPTGMGENGVLKVIIDDGEIAAVSEQSTLAASSQETTIEHTTTASLEDEVVTQAVCKLSPAVNDAPVISTPPAESIQAVASAVVAESIPCDVIKVAVIMKEGPQVYFVQRFDNNDKLKFICEEVVKSPSLPLVKPEVGMLCAAIFEGGWYRARVLLLTPQVAVQYVDYGNIDVCDPTTLHELPKSIVDFPPMAEKIEFVDNTPELSDGIIVSVIPTGENENGVMKVLFDDGKKVTVSTTMSSTEVLQGNTSTKEAQTSTASVQVKGIPPVATESTVNLSALNSASQANIIPPISSTKQEENSPPVISAPQAEISVPVILKVQEVCVSSDEAKVPKGEFKKAKITVSNNVDDYWVTWEHDLETVDKIILKTHENITSTPLANPKVGMLCVSKFEGIWFRARITKTSPELEVHYLDYGNSEICSVNDLQDIPEPIKDFLPMAFRIKLASGTPQEYHSLLPDDFLSINIVGQDEAGVCTVHVEGVSYPDVPDTRPAATKSVPSRCVTNPSQEVEALCPKANTLSEKSLIAQSQETIANVPVTTINASKFYDVRVAFSVGSNEYWVQRVVRDKDLQSVMIQVNDHVSKGIKTTLEVGKLCAAKFQSFWYRARINKVAPEIEVHFIDFGNTEICGSDDILECPESVQDMPPLALRIRLADGTPAKFSCLPVDSVFSVKPIAKTTDGLTIVQVEGIQYSTDAVGISVQGASSAVGASLERQQQPDNRLDFQNSCLKFLTTDRNSGGAIHFMKKYSGYYTVTAVTDASRHVYDKLIDLRKSGFELPTDESFKPAVGDVVLALSPSQEGMCRARIVSESRGSYRVVLLDCGIVETVVDVRDLPSALATLPTFAVKCVVTSFHVKETEFIDKCTKSEDAFIFQVLSVKNRQVICLVLSITNIPLVSVVLSVWEPSVEEMGLTHFVLRDGDPVRMSFFNGPENVFVTSLVPEHVQQFSTFSDTLHAYCSQARNLQAPPKVGDLLACKFVIDNRFYRCQVQSVTGSLCDIFYIDYGNFELGILYDKLKLISEDLKKFPCQCLEVRLKGVDTCKMTFEVTEFIKKLVDEGTALRIENHSDGVVLHTETGICINEKLTNVWDCIGTTDSVQYNSSPPGTSRGNDLAANEIKNISSELHLTTKSTTVQNHLPCKSPNFNKRIASSALKHRTFPLGELKLYVLSILKDLSVMACPSDPSDAEAVEALTSTMNDYCSRMSTEQYHPQVDEVCIAKFHVDDQWYRAVCLVANPAASTRKLMFVDYGNVEDVEVNSIRKMESQFMELPVLGEKCNIQGVDSRNKLVEKILRETIFTNNIYDVKVVKHLHTHYVVEIPKVTAALQAEGLYMEGM